MMRLTWFRCLLLVCTALSLTAATAVAKGSRIMAIDVTQNENADYDAAWALAEACGIENVGLSLDWDQIESTPGTFADPGGYVFAATNAYYPLAGASVTLTLRPLHNSVKPVPADLAATPFEDGSQVMATRFCAMLDWVMTQIPDVTIEALIVGSEYDVALGNDATLWSDYTSFVSRVVTHVHGSSYAARIPRIGAEATFTGYTNHASLVTAVNDLCDVVAISYYAIESDFDVRAMTDVRDDLDSLLSFGSASKPLCFYQFGCPSAWRDSGDVLHDRQTLQADFIATAFSFWDDNINTVRLLDFTWLHDLSPSEVATQATYFGYADPSFLTFLATLGLRTWDGDGSDKPAYLALIQAAADRSWTGGSSGGGGGSGSGGGSGGGSSSSSSGGGGGCGAGQGITGFAACLMFLAFTRQRPGQRHPRDRNPS